MMTSSNENIFLFTGPLSGEFTGLRWIPLTKSSNAELSCFFFIYPCINGWVHSRESGDLRLHRAYYDIIVIGFIMLWCGVVLPISVKGSSMALG